MRRLLKSTLAWAIIVTLTAVICLGVSLAVFFMFGSMKACFVVYFSVSVLILLWLGAFD